MKVLVAIKRVIDHRVKIRIANDGSSIDEAGVKMSINPFDEIALEEAVRLKEMGVAKHIQVISVGSAGVQESLRTALAFGADDAVFIKTEQQTQPYGVARALHRYASDKEFSLLLMGKQAIDDDANQVGQMVAALLGWPQATFASKLEVKDDIIKVDREIDGGIEQIEMPLPAVVTADLRLNKPRYISLPNIMKAKRKHIEIIDSGYEELLVPGIRVTRIFAPQHRHAGRMVETTDDLVTELKTKGFLV